jgi:tol-pal system protein YbgF
MCRIFSNEVKPALKKHAFTIIAVLALTGLGAPPAMAVSKETIQMMQQLDSLQQAVQTLQRTVDTQTAILRTLLQQTADNVSSMQQRVDALEKSTGKNLAATNDKMDNLSREVEALGASLDDTKAQLSKLSDQLAKTQNILQTLNTPPQPAPGTTGQPGATPDAAAPAQQAPAIPDADSLYNSALASYTSGQYPLAIQGFQEYLQYYGSTDRGSNAQFYIAECYYSQKDYAKAVDAYNVCIQQYPNGNKVRAAQLKKAYSLLELGERTSGIRELRQIMEKYPGTHEAALARQRLREVSSAGR